LFCAFSQFFYCFTVLRHTGGLRIDYAKNPPGPPMTLDNMEQESADADRSQGRRAGRYHTEAAAVRTKAHAD
jgi:hypothetical protein